GAGGDQWLSERHPAAGDDRRRSRDAAPGVLGPRGEGTVQAAHRLAQVGLSMGLLGVEDLSIAFGGLAALSGVSFEATEGEILALIGPNGAGKSTVFNVVTGLYRPAAGRVSFDGVDLLGLPPHAI